MESLILLSTLLTLTAPIRSQQLSFLHLPSSVSLTTTTSTNEASLGSDELEPLVANLLGIPTDLQWPGLTSFSSLDRPKANVLFIVDGFRSPADLGFDCDISKCFLIEGQVTNADLDGLKNLLVSTIREETPLVIENYDNGGVNAPSPNDFVDPGNAALKMGLESVDRISGALRMNQIFHPQHLNISRAADLEFLSELNSIQFLVDVLDGDNVQLLVKDDTADLFIFRFEAIEGVVKAYGEDSSQVQEMKTILKRFIEEVASIFENRLYGNNKVAIEVLTLPWTLGRSKRAAETETTRATEAPPATKTPPVIVDPNLAPAYDANYAIMFNVSIWTGIVLFIFLYTITYAFWNMEPDSDGYIYMMTKNRRE